MATSRDDAPTVWTGQERERALLDGLKDAHADLTLTPVEEALVHCAARDEVFSGNSEPRPYVRGAVLAWLLGTPAAVDLLPRRRLRLREVTVSDGIDLTNARTEAALELDGARVLGNIDLRNAWLGSISVANSEIGEDADGTVDATGCVLNGGFTLDGCRARDLRLEDATVRGRLSCRALTLANPDGVALNADNAQIDLEAFLTEGARFAGEVRLLCATIGGQLDCEGATFSNPAGDALSADGARVSGDVFLHKGARFEGAVRLLGATIDGQLDCEGGTFSNPAGDVISAKDAMVKQRADFSSANFSGNLVLRRASFPGGLSIDASGSEVASAIDLTDAIVSTIDIRGVPVVPLNMNGATYTRVEADPPAALPMIATALLEQWQGEYVAAQTYEHLASALRAAGQDGLARDVMVELHDRKRRDPDTNLWSRLWLRIFKVVMRYGYSPFRPLAFAAVIAATGTAIMLAGTYSGAVQSPHGTVRILGSFVTGFGALIPLDTLSVEPRGTKLTYSNAWHEAIYNLTWGWYWLESVTGWLLAAVSVAGLANLIRRV